MNHGHAESTRLLWAPAAWLGGRWHERVVLEIDAQGYWAAVTPDQAPPAQAEMLAGPALPGLVDAHSHAFQRAFAGLAERPEGASDDFWSWRDRMYRVANAITPESLKAIAAHLYLELLRGGYTQVCEFHYLQHRPDGQPYDDKLALSLALADAAALAGLGLTLLPVLYERAGFNAPALREDQRRFRAGADEVWRLSRDFEAQVMRRTGVPLNAGLAIHSVRAAEGASITRLRSLAEGFSGPIHIHVAEQRGELRDCVAATGATPLAWLAREGWLDPRWQLVHATHVTPHEIAATARSGAGVVICPSTEGNLGDGYTDLPGWLAAGVPLSIGSDSQVTRCWREELRWLEYGQRLRLERRNVAAAPPGLLRPPAGSAARLFEAVGAGGARAAGEVRWGLVCGARADLVVADPADTALAGLPRGRWLDALVFSSPGRPWRDVMVAGRWALRDHRHAAAAEIHTAFVQAMSALWPDDDA